jgi:release factor glutamine methyltransferase
MTNNINVLLKVAEKRLAEAGVPSPRHDAQALLDDLLGSPNARFVEQAVTPEVFADYLRRVERRAEREPLQHITGTAGFRRLALAVGAGVFVPRPETERLVEWGLAVLAGQETPTVVDLCAGSGAIALSVAAEFATASVYAVEQAPAALEWLNRTAAPYEKVTVVAADATEAQTLSTVDGTANLVLSNPPYVPNGTPVPPEVSRYDPPEALWGGPDGLTVVRGVMASAARLLRPGGWLGVEHAEVHAPAVLRLVQTAGFESVSTHPDLTGRPRFTVGRRRACRPTQ